MHVIVGTICSAPFIPFSIRTSVYIGLELFITFPIAVCFELATMASQCEMLAQFAIVSIPLALFARWNACLVYIYLQRRDIVAYNATESESPERLHLQYT